jgi:hypothetical protein
MKDNNNIVFRASWFKTLDRWSPELVKEFITVLDCYYHNRPIEITSDRVLDMWTNAQPLLDGDRERYTKRVQVNRENGKNGGAPKGNKNASKSTEINQEQPKTTEGLIKQPKQPIDKDNDKDNDNDNDNDIDNEIDKDIENENENENDIDKVKLNKEDKVSIHYIMDIENCSYDEALTLYLQQKELIFN